MPHHLLKASIVAALSVTVLAGCGGGGDDGSDGGDDFAVHSAEDVRQRFRELAGVDLEVSSSLTDSPTLTLSSTAEGTAARQRYGGFLISVSSDEETMERRRRTVSGGPSKAVENVIVTGLSSDADEFARVSRIVESLGTPVDRVRLPPEDTPCAKQGIDPDGGTGKTGTCLEKQQTVTVVDAAGPLELPVVTVARLTQRIGRSLTTRRFGLRRTVRARGAFVAIRARIENTSDAPLTSLRPDLVINGRRYAPDTRNSFSLAESPFPIQPGGVETVTFLFDVPRTADDPREGGALEFSADEEPYMSPERAGAVGRIRLRPGGSAPTGGTI
jgi:hypothetical protein